MSSASLCGPCSSLLVGAFWPVSCALSEACSTSVIASAADTYSHGIVIVSIAMASIAIVSTTSMAIESISHRKHNISSTAIVSMKKCLFVLRQDGLLKLGLTTPETLGGGGVVQPCPTRNRTEPEPAEIAGKTPFLIASSTAITHDSGSDQSPALQRAIQPRSMLAAKQTTSPTFHDASAVCAL